MKTSHKILISLAVAVLFCTVLRAQNSTTKVTPSELKYSTSANTNDAKSVSNVKPTENILSPEKQELLKQLSDARSSNNITAMRQIESNLNHLDGNSAVQLQEMNGVTGGPAFGDNKIINGSGHDFVINQIVNNGLWSSATQTVPAGMPNAGTIWVATTIINPAGGDTCKLYYSTDGGVNWTFGYFFNFTQNVDFRPGELDIELLYDGSTLWIYGTASFRLITNGEIIPMIFRFNTTTNTFNAYSLLWPGVNLSSNIYFNSRITSDNSNYTAASYIYIASAFDSTYATTMHYTAQKYAHITNPFDVSPVINFSQPGSNNTFHWYTNGLPANTYVWSDIAYFKTQGNKDRIITVYSPQSNGASHNLFTAWSDDYGTSLTGSGIISEANPNWGAKIAFNGGANNYNGMIACVRKSNGNSSDPYYISTTDGGLTWHEGSIEQPASLTRSIDVIAVRGGANLFKVAYTKDSTTGTFGYYTGGNLNGWNQPAAHTVTPAGVDTMFTKVIAGYKNGGGDDCFALYSLGQGANLYGSISCMTTIGIINNNNGVPKDYSLKQNYPNPFNPSTNISFSIPKTGVVKLVVYDITGKEVAAPVNAYMNAGSYTVNFDASSLSSGAYFYKLETDGFSATKKMLLIK